MGLSVTAYSAVSQEDAPVNEFTTEFVQVATNPNFPLQSGHHLDGWYSYSDFYSFAAGSYSGYSDWRNDLAKLAGYEPHPLTSKRSYATTVWNEVEGPFWELINFSDCEGIICASVAAKLYKDFAKYENRAKKEDRYFYSVYTEFKEACRLASDHGFINFH